MQFIPGLPVAGKKNAILYIMYYVLYIIPVIIYKPEADALDEAASKASIAKQARVLWCDAVA